MMTGVGGGSSGGGGAITFSCAFVDHKEDAVGGSSITYPTPNFGATDPNRVVVVGLGSRTANATAITSVSVNGTSASLVAAGAANVSADGTARVEIWQATGVSGTSGNIVVNWGEAQNRSFITVYRVVTGTTAATAATGVASNSADSLTTPAYTVPSGGCGINVYANRNGSPNTVTWSGTTITKDVDVSIASTSEMSSASNFVAGSVTITANPGVGGAGGGSSALSSAAWGP
jgi:hypothetical protein